MGFVIVSAAVSLKCLHLYGNHYLCLVILILATKNFSLSKGGNFKKMLNISKRTDNCSLGNGNNK